MAQVTWLERNKAQKLVDHTAAGTTVIASPSVNMHDDGGSEGVVFITSFGTANATNNYCYAEQSADDSSWTSVTSHAVLSSGSSDEDVMLEVRHPTKQYVRLYVGRATSSTVESIWAIRYGARHRPVTSNSLSGTSISVTQEGPS
jgi:hypothetical protein